MFLARKPSGGLFRIPSVVVVILGVAAGVINAIVIGNVFTIVQPWKQLLVAAVLILGTLHVAPITGKTLRTVLHMSANAAASASVALVALTGLIETLSVGVATKGVLIGVVSLIGTVLFGSVGAVAPKV
jgi:hypothetical protein